MWDDLFRNLNANKGFDQAARDRGTNFGGYDENNITEEEFMNAFARGFRQGAGESIPIWQDGAYGQICTHEQLIKEVHPYYNNMIIYEVAKQSSDRTMLRVNLYRLCQLRPHLKETVRAFWRSYETYEKASNDVLINRMDAQCTIQRM